MKHLPQICKTTGRCIHSGDMVHVGGEGWRLVLSVDAGTSGNLGVVLADGRRVSYPLHAELHVLRDQPHTPDTLES